MHKQLSARGIPPRVAAGHRHRHRHRPSSPAALFAPLPTSHPSSLSFLSFPPNRSPRCCPCLVPPVIFSPPSPCCAAPDQAIASSPRRRPPSADRSTVPRTTKAAALVRVPPGVSPLYWTRPRRRPVVARVRSPFLYLPELFPAPSFPHRATTADTPFFSGAPPEKTTLPPRCRPPRSRRPPFPCCDRRDHCRLLPLLFCHRQEQFAAGREGPSFAGRHAHPRVWFEPSSSRLALADRRRLTTLSIFNLELNI